MIYIRHSPHPSPVLLCPQDTFQQVAMKSPSPYLGRRFWHSPSKQKYRERNSCMLKCRS